MAARKDRDRTAKRPTSLDGGTPEHPATHREAAFSGHDDAVDGSPTHAGPEPGGPQIAGVPGQPDRLLRQARGLRGERQKHT